MFRKVAIQNFKGLRALELELSPFTIVIGSNATGKTSLLQAIQLLGQSPDENLVDLLRPFGSSAAIVSRSTTAFHLDAVRASSRGDLSISAGASRDAKSLRWNYDATVRLGTSELANANQRLRESDAALGQELGSCQLLALDPKALAEPSFLSATTPALGARGEGLASLIAALAASPRRERFGALEAELRRLVPVVRSLGAVPVSVEGWVPGADDGEKISHRKQPFPGHALSVDTVDGDGIPGDALSEGTLLVLGILATLHQSDAPSIVLIDGLERGLHPAAQREFAAGLRALVANRKGTLQIIATTHSPLVLSEVPREDVWVLTRTAAGIEAQRPAETYGRETDWILGTSFETSTRPPEIAKDFRLLFQAIDDGRLEDARRLKARLADAIGPQDPGLVKAATLLHLSGEPDADHPETL